MLSTRSEPSTRMTRACPGSMWRKSPRKTRLASSAIAPASSTPVGPPPTTTIVISRRVSSGSGLLSARSNDVSTRRRIAIASSSVLSPSACPRHCSLPK